MQSALLEKKEVGAYAIKRVAGGAHLPTPWLFEPAKCPTNKADYFLDSRNDPNKFCHCTFTYWNDSVCSSSLYMDPGADGTAIDTVCLVAGDKISTTYSKSMIING